MFSPSLRSLNDEFDLARRGARVGGQLLQEEAVDVVQGDVKAFDRSQDVTGF